MISRQTINNTGFAAFSGVKDPVLNATLGGLSNVDTSSAVTGNVLVYNSASQSWNAQAPPAGGPTTYAALTDVSTVSRSDGSATHYNSASGKYEVANEIKVLPSSRDVVVNTPGQTSLISGGPASLQSINSQAVVSAATNAFVTAATGDATLSSTTGTAAVFGGLNAEMTTATNGMIALVPNTGGSSIAEIGEDHISAAAYATRIETAPVSAIPNVQFVNNARGLLRGGTTATLREFQTGTGPATSGGFVALDALSAPTTDFSAVSTFKFDARAYQTGTQTDFNLTHMDNIGDRFQISLNPRDDIPVGNTGVYTVTAEPFFEGFSKVVPCTYIGGNAASPLAAGEIFIVDRVAVDAATDKVTKGGDATASTLTIGTISDQPLVLIQNNTPRLTFDVVDDLMLTPVTYATGFYNDETVVNVKLVNRLPFLRGTPNATVRCYQAVGPPGVPNPGAFSMLDSGDVPTLDYTLAAKFVIDIRNHPTGCDTSAILNRIMLAGEQFVIAQNPTATVPFSNTAQYLVTGVLPQIGDTRTYTVSYVSGIHPNPPTPMSPDCLFVFDKVSPSGIDVENKVSRGGEPLGTGDLVMGTTDVSNVSLMRDSKTFLIHGGKDISILSAGAKGIACIIEATDSAMAISESNFSARLEGEDRISADGVSVYLTPGPAPDGVVLISQNLKTATQYAADIDTLGATDQVPNALWVLQKTGEVATNAVRKGGEPLGSGALTIGVGDAETVSVKQNDTNFLVHNGGEVTLSEGGGAKSVRMINASEGIFLEGEVRIIASNSNRLTCNGDGVSLIPASNANGLIRVSENEKSASQYASDCSTVNSAVPNVEFVNNAVAGVPLSQYAVKGGEVAGDLIIGTQQVEPVSIISGGNTVAAFDENSSTIESLVVASIRRVGAGTATAVNATDGAVFVEVAGEPRFIADEENTALIPAPTGFARIATDPEDYKNLIDATEEGAKQDVIPNYRWLNRFLLPFAKYDMDQAPSVIPAVPVVQGTYYDLIPTLPGSASISGSAFGTYGVGVAGDRLQIVSDVLGVWDAVIQFSVTGNINSNKRQSSFRLMQDGNQVGNIVYLAGGDAGTYQTTTSSEIFCTNVVNGTNFTVQWANQTNNDEFDFVQLHISMRAVNKIAY